MSRAFRAAAALVALTLAAVMLAACGSGSNNATKLLGQTFGTHSKKVTSGKLALSVDVAAHAVRNLQQPVTIRLSGPFQSLGPRQLPKFDFSLVLSGGGQNLTAGAVTTGDKGFLSFRGTTYAVPDNIFAQFKQSFQQAQAQGARKNQPTLKSLGFDPLRWLKNPKLVGDATVGGAATRHVTAGIDVSRFLDDVNGIISKAGSLGALPGSTSLSRPLTPQQKAQVAKAIKSASLDVYTGKDDKLLRKLSVNLKVASQSGQSGNVAFALELDDLNAPQTISAPANARPPAELTKKLSGLGSLLGGASGSSGSSTGPGARGSSGSSSAVKTQAYSKCITDAGGDLAKAQKCVKFLK